MSRRDAWARPQDTPLAYIILLAYAVLMFNGRPPDSELTLVQWGRYHLSSSGWEVQQGQVWRLLSYAFVHGGFVHVAMNAMSLLALGPALERWLGTAKFALLYAITAIGGALAAIWWDGPLTPLVGGSGALFGMIGAYVAINMRAGRHLLDFLEHGGASSLLGVLAANLILGLVVPQISNSAHLGGLLSGFVLTFFSLSLLFSSLLSLLDLFVSLLPADLCALCVLCVFSVEQQLHCSRKASWRAGGLTGVPQKKHRAHREHRDQQGAEIEIEIEIEVQSQPA
jgi:rhomboid protease GluP